MNRFASRIPALLAAAPRVAAAWVVLMAIASFAPAQTAPEGNAHPATQNVANSGKVTNPFGPHLADLSKVCLQADKAVFAAAVNVEPLRSLAVFHNGRVKVLQSLASETVAKIAGRRNYVDFIKTPRAGGGEDVRDVKYDAMFTLLDMTIDPGYYIDKPLVAVEYLPLREAILVAAFPGKEEDEVRERWKRVGRVTPVMIERYLGQVAQDNAASEPYIRAAGRVDDAVRMFMDGKSNFMMVAPANTDAPWSHLSTLDESNPARKAALELGAAWRARDPARANAAIAQLATELPQIHASVYPAGRRSLEALYNKVNAFEWGYWAYFLSLLLLLLAFGTRRSTLAFAGVSMLAVALSLHAFGFAARCVIAERFAIQNQFESMTGLSLFAALVGATVMILRRQWLFGAAAAAVGFMVLLAATQAGIPGAYIEREAAILNTSALLKYHVTTVLVSYGLISLGFVCSLFYLAAHYAKGGAAIAATAGGVAMSVGDASGETPARARLLADLDAAQMIILQLAFWALGVGILLGAWWADHSWGRWWAFDPKETWALITWIVYLIVVHVRVGAPAKKGILTAWLSVAGFIVMLWTYFGVNLLLPGLHAYA